MHMDQPRNVIILSELKLMGVLMTQFTFLYCALCWISDIAIKLLSALESNVTIKDIVFVDFFIGNSNLKLKEE